jgi:hypothetical protein
MGLPGILTSTLLAATAAAGGALAATRPLPPVTVSGNVHCLDRHSPWICWTPRSRAVITLTTPARVPAVTWVPEVLGGYVEMTSLPTGQPRVTSWQVTFRHPAELVF